MGVDKILFDTLKSNTKKLKCFGLLSLFKNKFLNQMHFLDINIKLEQIKTIGTICFIFKHRLVNDQRVKTSSMYSALCICVGTFLILLNNQVWFFLFILVNICG